VSSFVNPNGRAERAIALCQPTHTMAWSKEEIEDLVIRQPKLGIALIQAMLHQSLVVQELLHSVAFENLSDRVARMILMLCGRLGERVEDGSIRMPALTHDLLGKCVGTSREIVTLKMNEMRRRGYLRYSRQNIFVYEDALREHYRVRPA
jgi:CRP-like cAMP-binding protein